MFLFVFIAVLNETTREMNESRLFGLIDSLLWGLSGVDKVREVVEKGPVWGRCFVAG